MNLDYVHLILNNRRISRLSVEPGNLFGDDFGSYFETPSLSSMELSVNRPTVFARDFLEPLYIKNTIRYCSGAASILIDAAIKAGSTPLSYDDKERLFSFLKSVIHEFKILESANLTFSYDDDGFRRLAEYTSLVCYVFYEVHFISSFFKLYSNLSFRLKHEYLGFKYFRSHLILNNLDSNKKTVCHIVKINSFNRFMHMLHDFC